MVANPKYSISVQDLRKFVGETSTLVASAVSFIWLTMTVTTDEEYLITILAFIDIAYCQSLYERRHAPSATDYSPSRRKR